MKKTSLFVLLIGGLFSSAAFSKSVMRDAVVFKVARKVFSLNDLRSYYQEVNNLKCIYKDSILTKIFSDEFSGEKSGLFEFQHPFSEKQKKYFQDLVEFAKLLVYSEAQTVVVKPSITKYFYLNAQRSGCPLDSFKENKDMKPRLREVTRLEVFARSRFLPNEKSGIATKDDIDKAIISAENLLKSIGKQIDDEYYWP